MVSNAVKSDADVGKQGTKVSKVCLLQNRKHE